MYLFACIPVFLSPVYCGILGKTVLFEANTVEFWENKVVYWKNAVVLLGKYNVNWGKYSGQIQ